MRLNGSISVGNLLTIGAMLASLVFYLAAIEPSLKAEVRERKAADQWIVRQADIDRTSLGAALARIEAELREINRKLDQKADR